jgi:acetyl esterase/lipase
VAADKTKETAMSSAHLIDPELVVGLDMLPALDFSVVDIVQVRELLAMTRGAVPEIEVPGVESFWLSVPGPAGAPEVRVAVHRPAEAAAPVPAILHIHGGGYVIGEPGVADIANRMLVAELGCAIYSVDYRLAPETAHPGPVEDCFAALSYVAAHAASLGVDATRIGVMGESAGGGLAAALALLARDRGGPKLAFQHLIYPMLDDRTCTVADPHPFTGEFVWTPAQNHYGWGALLGQAPGGADISPYAAAARAEDLSGLPPAFIAVGALDLFLEEDLDYARRLTRAGVPVELHVYPGAYHGFHFAPEATVTQAANRDSLAALRRALAG